jgi:hypothetical protein
VLFNVLPDDRITPAERRRYTAVIDASDTRLTADKLMERLPSSRSHFEAPATVRVSASRPAGGDELTLHFVNYNREAPADKKNPGNGIRNERPIAAPISQADLNLNRKQRVRRIEFLTPETDQPRELEFEQTGSRLRFRVPEFLVYGVVRVQLAN